MWRRRLLALALALALRTLGERDDINRNNPRAPRPVASAALGSSAMRHLKD